MTRLIDADELLDWSEIIPLTDDGGIDINDFEEKLKTMPTVDAIPVVRCKDCRFGRETCGNIECQGEYHSYDWFCPNGKRREDVHTD